MRQLPQYDRTRLWSLTRRRTTIPIELTAPTTKKSSVNIAPDEKVIKKVRFEDEVIEKAICMPQQ